MSSLSVESEVGGRDCADDVWNSTRSWRDSRVEVDMHVESSLPADRVVVTPSAAQRTGRRRGDVDRPRRLTSFSVADILGPRIGTSHHHQQQQHDDVTDDVSESTSSQSNDDLSSSVLSHGSSTEGPSPTGTDRDRCWAETDRQHSTSREFIASHYVIISVVIVKVDAFNLTIYNRILAITSLRVPRSSFTVHCLNRTKQVVTCIADQKWGAGWGQRKRRGPRLYGYAWTNFCCTKIIRMRDNHR